MQIYRPHFQAYGEHAVLIEWPPSIDAAILNDILAFKEVLVIELDAYSIEYVTAYASLLLIFDPNELSSLALVGIGDDTLQASIDSRAPEQSTGKAGRKLPEEFQRGLDKYFSVLEGAETDE